MARVTQPLSRGATVRQQRRRLGRWLWASCWPWLAKQAPALQTLSIIAAALSVVWGVATFVAEAPQREKQAEDARKASHYTAWQVINGAHGQSVSGGRIDALEALARDGVSLANLEVGRAFLNGVNLAGADLRYADMSQTSLLEADLEGVTLQGGTLVEADLINANLRNAVLGRGHVDLVVDHDRWDGSSGQMYRSIRAADLKGIDLSYSDLTGAHMREVNLTDAGLVRAKLKHADLSFANLRRTSLRGADLAYAQLVGIHNWTVEQLTSAKNWHLAHYDADVSAALGLPYHATATPNRVWIWDWVVPTITPSITP